ISRAQRRGNPKIRRSPRALEPGCQPRCRLLMAFAGLSVVASRPQRSITGNFAHPTVASSGIRFAVKEPFPQSQGSDRTPYRRSVMYRDNRGHRISRARWREMLGAFNNRQDLVKAGLMNRREWLELGFLTGAGCLVPK